MGHNPERDRKRYVRDEVHAERHARRMFRGEYDHVADQPITAAEREEAERDLEEGELATSLYFPKGV
jgi:hypothetical protein